MQIPNMPLSVLASMAPALGDPYFTWGPLGPVEIKFMLAMQANYSFVTDNEVPVNDIALMAQPSEGAQAWLMVDAEIDSIEGRWQPVGDDYDTTSPDFTEYGIPLDKTESMGTVLYHGEHMVLRGSDSVTACYWLLRAV